MVIYFNAFNAMNIVIAWKTCKNISDRHARTEHCCCYEPTIYFMRRKLSKAQRRILKTFVCSLPYQMWTTEGVEFCIAGYTANVHCTVYVLHSSCIFHINRYSRYVHNWVKYCHGFLTAFERCCFNISSSFPGDGNILGIYFLNQFINHV